MHVFYIRFQLIIVNAKQLVYELHRILDFYTAGLHVHRRLLYVP